MELAQIKQQQRDAMDRVQRADSERATRGAFESENEEGEEDGYAGIQPGVAGFLRKENALAKEETGTSESKSEGKKKTNFTEDVRTALNGSLLHSNGPIVKIEEWFNLSSSELDAWERDADRMFGTGLSVL